MSKVSLSKGELPKSQRRHDHGAGYTLQLENYGEFRDNKDNAIEQTPDRLRTPGRSPLLYPLGLHDLVSQQG